MSEKRKYEKYEFCKSVCCEELEPYGCGRKDLPVSWCIKSARHFHHWLKENGFEIVKIGDKNE